MMPQMQMQPPMQMGGAPMAADAYPPNMHAMAAMQMQMMPGGAGAPPGMGDAGEQMGGDEEKDGTETTEEGGANAEEQGALGGPDWQEMKAESGQKYWYNKATGISQWDAPPSA